MRFTLGEAAKATGKSKAALSRAIKNGSLSAERQTNGSYHIEASELYRVYPPVQPEPLTQPFSATPDATPGTAEMKELQARLEAAEQRIRDKDSVIDDLRRRLDAESEERRRTQAILTGLLTDQRTHPGAPSPGQKRGFWRKLFSKEPR